MDTQNEQLLEGNSYSLPIKKQKKTGREKRGLRLGPSLIPKEATNIAT